MSSPVPGEPQRLTPAMSSRRLQVLDFVQQYIATHNESPSLAEIAAGCSINRARAHQLVNALVKAKLLLRRRGARGLMLPSIIEEAERRLREAGFIVFTRVEGADPYTDSRLLPLVELDYVPKGRVGDRSGNRTGRKRVARSRPGK